MVTPNRIMLPLDEVSSYVNNALRQSVANALMTGTDHHANNVVTKMADWNYYDYLRELVEEIHRGDAINPSTNSKATKLLIAQGLSPTDAINVTTAAYKLIVDIIGAALPYITFGDLPTYSFGVCTGPVLMMTLFHKEDSTC